MAVLRGLARRLARAWNRHPVLLGVPAGVALAAAWIAFAPAGARAHTDLWFLGAWTGLTTLVVVVARGWSRDEDER